MRRDTGQDTRQDMSRDTSRPSLFRTLQRIEQFTRAQREDLKSVRQEWKDMRALIPVSSQFKGQLLLFAQQFPLALVSLVPLYALLVTVTLGLSFLFLGSWGAVCACFAGGVVASAVLYGSINLSVYFEIRCRRRIIANTWQRPLLPAQGGQAASVAIPMQTLHNHAELASTTVQQHHS